MAVGFPIRIPWNKGWYWGNNSVQRWCDQHCEGNYEARCFTTGYANQEIRVLFQNEKDATMFMMFYKDDNGN
jgi:hypothetical protein